MLDTLLVCGTCGHGASLHAGGGCEALRCTCSATKDDLVEDLVVEERDEYRTKWDAKKTRIPS